jgi:GTPase SAR1 family protein
VELVILIGNCKVGKTSFLNFVVGKAVSQKNITPTIGVEYAPINIKVGSNDVRVNIWDTCKASCMKPGLSNTNR